MQGVEKAYANAAIRAVCAANKYLLLTPIKDALKPVVAYGKRDTLDLDARTEISIAEELGRFDSSALLISEEQGPKVKPIWWTELNGLQSPVIFVADPTDRSIQLKTYLDGVKRKSRRVATEVGRDGAIRRWEESFGEPATITGACSAVTCLFHGLPICSAIVNYVTQHLYVACAAGTRMLPLDIGGAPPELDDVLRNGELIKFPPVSVADVEPMNKFITFLGKKGYRENLLSSNLMDAQAIKRRLRYGMPGGPLRVLYLSRLQGDANPLGFILANGEKIGEWVHWLAYVRFAALEHDASEPALKLFEIFQDKPGTKEGVLMAPTPAYSPFNMTSGNGRFTIDPLRLSCHDNPSKVRATLMVTPRHNSEVRRIMEQQGFRRIVFPSPH